MLALCELGLRSPGVHTQLCEAGRGGGVNLMLNMGFENPRETKSPAECSSRNLQLYGVLTLLLTLLIIEMEGAYDA